MKKCILILFASACTLSGFAQTAHYQFSTDHYESIIQGLGEESLSLPHAKPIKLATIEVEAGNKLHYAECGNAGGTPVIFLHGICDSWHSYEKVLPLLPEDIHAFAITQRGHGNSDKRFIGYTAKDFARDIATFIRKKELKNVIIVGHSMGGAVAQQVAIDYPELLQKLVIVGSAASFQDIPGMPEFYQQVLALKDSIDKQFMHEFQKACLAKPIDPAYFDTLVAEGLKTPLPVFKRALTGLMNFDLKPQLPQFKKPVLLVWGEMDAFMPRATQDQLLKHLPNAKLLAYQNTGHGLHWEEPERFVSNLMAFIQDQSVQNEEAEK